MEQLELPFYGCVSDDLHSAARKRLLEASGYEVSNGAPIQRHLPYTVPEQYSTDEYLRCLHTGR